MEMEVLILGASRYDFLDGENKQIKGTKVQFVQLTHIYETDKIGYFPSTAVVPYGQFNDFESEKFPLTAKADWILDMSNKKNPVKITGFKEFNNVAI